MDVSRSRLWPLLSGIAAAALVVGIYLSGNLPHGDTPVSAPATPASPALAALEAADAALQRGDKKTARSQARIGVNLAPLNGPIEERAGQIELDAGDLAAAQQDFTLAEIAAPRDPSSYIALSDILVRQGKPLAAEAPLRFGLLRAPAAPKLHYNLALLELTRGDQADALKDFRSEPKTSVFYREAQIGISMARGYSSAETPIPVVAHAHTPAAVAPPVEPVAVVPVEPVATVRPAPVATTQAEPAATLAPRVVVAPVAVAPVVVAPVRHVVAPAATRPPSVETPAATPAARVVRGVVARAGRPAISQPPSVSAPRLRGASAAPASPTPAPRKPVVRIARRQPTPAPNYVPWTPSRVAAPRELVPVSTVTAAPPASDKLTPVETVTAPPPQPAAT